MGQTAAKIGFENQAPDKFIIAERYAGTPWPVVGPVAAKINEARGQYERGEIEMAQRRVGRMEYQYAIPRKYTGTPRPGYFEPQH